MSRATLHGLGALVLWAFLALLAQGTAGLPPLQVTAMAFAAGGGVSLAWLAARGQLAALRQPPLAWAHGVGGLFGYHALYFAALAWAPPVEASLINYLWPLLIVLLSAPILGLRLGPRRLAGVVLGLVGCALVVGPGAAFPPGAAPGFLCAAAAALVWALYSVTARRLAGVPTEAVAGFCLASAALAGLAHLAFEPTVVPDARQWGATLLLGLGPVGAAFFLWDIGMKQGDPRLLGTLAYATPVASTLLLLLAGVGSAGPRVLAASALVIGGGWLAASARDAAPAASPRRAGVIAEVDVPGEAEAAEAWIRAARPRLTHVSEQEGCGCCVLLWTVEGPEEVLATLPPHLRCDVPGPAGRHCP